MKKRKKSPRVTLKNEGKKQAGYKHCATVGYTTPYNACISYIIYLIHTLYNTSSSSAIISQFRNTNLSLKTK